MTRGELARFYVRCPFCAARPGERCVAKSTGKPRQNHTQRNAAWQRRRERARVR